MRKMLSLTRGCIDGYSMINPGDKIAVGVSGGKDSLSLLVLLAELRRFYPSPFQLVAITLDMGFKNADFGPVARLCEKIDVPYIIKKTDIAHVIFDVRQEANPCSLCAKMRRGLLNTAALDAGARKIALGHHLDDAVETFMLSLLYEGKIGCFMPVTYLDRMDVTHIRPLLYASEREVRNFAARQNLPVIHNPCPADKHTKREEVKTLLARLEKDYPGLRKRLFGALQRSPLPGWNKTLQEVYTSENLPD